MSESSNAVAGSAADVDLKWTVDEKRAARVLVVEDNLGFAYVIKDMLTREFAGQFSVKQVSTLAEACAFLKSYAVDVVLLDLGLPDSVRIDTYRNIYAAAPETPVIILTVLDDDDVAMQAMRLGAQDYLVKEHVTAAFLQKSIRYAIERARIHRALRQLTARLLEFQDEERRRMARALHDSTAQNLAALSMNLSTLRSMSGMSDQARALLSESEAFVATCSSEVRTMSYLLHPPLLDEFGLAGAVREYADGFAARSGIRVDLELSDGLDRLSRDVGTALFRIMQECLTNIHRHSGSATASISILRDRDTVVLTVRDAGHGMPAATGEHETAYGVGIPGMRERVRLLGGQLAITSNASGTCVRAQLPVLDQETP